MKYRALTAGIFAGLLLPAALAMADPASQISEA